MEDRTGLLMQCAAPEARDSHGPERCPRDASLALDARGLSEASGGSAAGLCRVSRDRSLTR
eukprot:1032750-Prymnesium_polylepis.1